MGEENNVRPDARQNKQSKFKFLIPDDKQTLRNAEVVHVDKKNKKNVQNITFDSDVDLTVQFESKGYDTQRYNIKKLVNERLYETQVFDISRISEAIVETINELEEKGVESFQDLEIVDDHEFETNDNYNRSLNILVTEVERKQYTEHVEIDEEAFKEQSQIIKNELERILRNNSLENANENILENFTNELNNSEIVGNEVSQGNNAGFNILLSDDFVENVENREFENDDANINLGFGLLDSFEENTQNLAQGEAEYIAEEIQTGFNGLVDEDLVDVSSSEIDNNKLLEDEGDYITFDNEDLDNLNDELIEDSIYNNVQLKLLNDDELEALAERSYLTAKSVNTSKSTNFVNKLSIDEEKRLQANKFFNENYEHIDESLENKDIKSKISMYLGVILIGVLVCAIVFFTAKIVLNIYDNNHVEYDFEENGSGVSSGDPTIPVIDGVASDYSAVVEIVSNNSSCEVREITNEDFIYDDVSSSTDYFDEYVYANTKNLDYNYVVLFGKDDNSHFGSIKYLSDEDFFNTLKVNYNVDGNIEEYSTLGYYKTKELDPALLKQLSSKELDEFKSNEFAKSEHSKGITLTSDSSLLTLVTYDTQEDVYHVAHFIGN